MNKIRDFSTPLSITDRTIRQKRSKQKISKDVREWNRTINKLDLADIYGGFHPADAEYTFPSGAHKIFIKIDHVLNHKTRSKTFERIQVIL